MRAQPPEVSPTQVPPDQHPHVTARSALAQGLRALWRRPRQSIPFLALTLSQGVFQTLLIYTITSVLRGSAYFVGAVLVFVVWSLRTWSSYFASVLSTRVAIDAETEATRIVLRRILRMPIDFFDRHSDGDLLLTAHHDVQSVRVVTLQTGQMLLFLARILALGVAAMALSVKMALIGLACVPLVLIPAYRLGGRIRKVSDRHRASKRMLHDNYMQISRGVATIKTYGIGQRIQQRAREISESSLETAVERAERSGFSKSILETASGVGLALIVCIGGYDVADGSLDWQALLGILMALVALYQPFLNLLASYNAICSVLPSLDKITRLQHVVRSDRDRRGRRRLWGAPEVIDLEDVGYRYQSERVLKGVTMQVRRGEMIGIVGKTGSGKSTLLSLLMGLRAPTEGRITYDGVDLRDLRQGDLHGLMALVPQEPVLFMDSVADNIRVGAPGASQEEVEAAARAAQVHDEILSMEGGYAARLAEGSGTADDSLARGLSVGQKQRLCIAAAMLRDAPLVFLDEATSSVDSATEERIQTATDRLLHGRTSFVIAHRLSTLRQASRIAVMQGGQLVGFGTHEELLATCPAYELLWTTQFGVDGAPASP